MQVLISILWGPSITFLIYVRIKYLIIASECSLYAQANVKPNLDRTEIVDWSSRLNLKMQPGK